MLTKKQGLVVGQGFIIQAKGGYPFEGELFDWSITPTGRSPEISV